MKKVLVAVADYPRNTGECALMFAHVRNLYYVSNGISVTVLNFAVDFDYEIDGIKVISLSTYHRSKSKYDVLICHAPNLRNHFRFLLKNKEAFNKCIFVFHGHEILRISTAYPKPYSFEQKNTLLNLLRDIYDFGKIKIWKHFILTNIENIDLVFVSNWLLDAFLNNTKMELNKIKDHVHVINNSVGKVFQDNNYDYKCEKEYDFITVRSALDNSTYCVDLLCQIANRNPKLKFLLIGKGKYFDYYELPNNITWINTYLSHDEILSYLNQSRCALLLTRHDTQGVMSCECATYGIPVVTSNIKVCQEIFSVFDNVQLISNDVRNINIESTLNDLVLGLPYRKETKYFCENTIEKEVHLINGR